MGGLLFERGDYFKYFGQRGRLFEGGLLFEEYINFNYSKNPRVKNLLDKNLPVRSLLYKNLFTLKFETLILIF